MYEIPWSGKAPWSADSDVGERKGIVSDRSIKTIGNSPLITPAANTQAGLILAEKCRLCFDEHLRILNGWKGVSALAITRANP